MQIKDSHFGVRVSRADAELLRAAAGDANLRVSTFIRLAALAAARRRNRPASVEVETDSGSLEVVPLS
jgi:hypothetical protein